MTDAAPPPEPEPPAPPVIPVNGLPPLMLPQAREEWTRAYLASIVQPNMLELAVNAHIDSMRISVLADMLCGAKLIEAPDLLARTAHKLLAEASRLKDERSRVIVAAQLNAERARGPRGS
ncbi:MAG: hypothetical protein ACRETH_01610 [Steroidobacteraceae bacterium]